MRRQFGTYGGPSNGEFNPFTAAPNADNRLPTGPRRQRARRPQRPGCPLTPGGAKELCRMRARRSQPELSIFAPCHRQFGCAYQGRSTSETLFIAIVPPQRDTLVRPAGPIESRAAAYRRTANHLSYHQATNVRVDRKRHRGLRVCALCASGFVGNRRASRSISRVVRSCAQRRRVEGTPRP